MIIDFLPLLHSLLFAILGLLGAVAALALPVFGVFTAVRLWRDR